jgi:hypothetical protein
MLPHGCTRNTKVIMIGCHNFEDEAIIIRWCACKKMNATSGKFKYENKQSNHQKLFLFVTRSCVYFQSYGIHRNINVESMIEKL